MVEGVTRFPDRLFEAKHALEGRMRGRLTNAEFGALVGRQMGRDPFSAASVSQWLSGKQGVSLELAQAIARVCGVRPAWLAWGEGEMRADDTARIPTPDYLPPVYEQETELITDASQLAPPETDQPRRKRGGQGA